MRFGGQQPIMIFDGMVHGYKSPVHFNNGPATKISIKLTVKDFLMLLDSNSVG